MITVITVDTVSWCRRCRPLVFGNQTAAVNRIYSSASQLPLMNYSAWVMFLHTNISAASFMLFELYFMQISVHSTPEIKTTLRTAPSAQSNYTFTKIGIGASHISTMSEYFLWAAAAADVFELKASARVDSHTVTLMKFYCFSTKTTWTLQICSPTGRARIFIANMLVICIFIII